MLIDVSHYIFSNFLISKCDCVQHFYTSNFDLYILISDVEKLNKFFLVCKVVALYKLK